MSFPIRYEDLADLSLNDRQRLRDQLTQSGYELIEATGESVGAGAETIAEDGTWRPTQNASRPAAEGYRLARRKIPGHPIWAKSQRNGAPQQPPTALSAQKENTLTQPNGLNDVWQNVIGTAKAAAMGSLAQVSISVGRGKLADLLESGYPQLAGMLRSPGGEAVAAVLVPILFQIAATQLPNQRVVQGISAAMAPALQVGIMRSTDTVINQLALPMGMAVMEALGPGIMGALGGEPEAK
jgi:hypothetical protein